MSHTLPQVYRSGLRRRTLTAVVLILATSCVVWAAISLSTSTNYTQNFDGMTATATAALPADFKVDKLTTARTVGNYSTAVSSTTLLGGANLSSSAGNGIYNFGAGTTTTGPDRAVGFVSSGSGTVSGNLYAQFANNTGSPITALQISYNVEKYRLGINAAGFCIQLYSSPDGAAWTSAGSTFRTSFPQDGGTVNSGFATAPGATVAVSGTLNVTIPDSSSYYLAWNYSVCSGTTSTNAQALAIDDISILAVGNGPTNPTATGLATPSTVLDGSSTLLTVSVTPGANPTSTALAVTADLTAIGGSATQTLFDDGTHGDVTAGDNVFSFQATVLSGTAAGAKSLPASITDAQSRSGSASIALTVTPSSTPPSATGAANPNSLQASNSTLLVVTVTPGTNPTSTGIAVSGDLSSIGGAASQTFYDDGTHGDVTAGDNVFSFQATVAGGTSAGTKSLPLSISDAQSRNSSASISLSVTPPPPANTVKISQVYGGGGNSGSTYTNDFIEIYNQDSNPVDLAGWSVQYSSAGATTWTATTLCTSSCLLQPGHYFLVKESAGTGGTTPLPAADATGTLALSGTQGKIALVAGTAALTGACGTGGAIVDLVGFGAANCSETAAAAGLSNTTASIRRGNGCIDTDNNQNDFFTGGPIPRNTQSPANFCGGDPTQPSAQGIATPNAVDPAGNTLLTVTVAPATSPASTGLGVVGDLTAIGGSVTQQFYDDGTHGDATAADNVFSYLATVGAAIGTGAKSMVATVTDAESRTATAPITLTVVSPTCGVERWSVKVGTDPDAGNVDLSHAVRASIFDLGLLTPPAEPPDNSRVVPTENTVFVINGLMTFYKKESDVDYHIVVQDPDGHTLITEIPSPACLLLNGSPRVLGPSPFATGIAAARQNFDSHLTAQTFFQNAQVPVQIKGVGFFDFIHGQTGVAPNGIELHPVLEINFTKPTTTTLVTAPNPSQYAQSFTSTVTVSNGGTPVPTGNVSLFEGSTLIATATLDPSGTATFSTNSLSVGSHSLTAGYEGDSTSAESRSAVVTHVVNKADQTITFGALAGKTFGDPDFTVSATASSSLAVSFSIASGPATIAGNTVHITGAGSVTVRASQSGDGNYNAAPDVEQSFNVSAAGQTINFAPLSDKTYGDAPFTVSATGGASGNPVTFSASGNCSSGGTNGSTITITGGGSCSVTASQAGNSNFNAATDVTRSFTINRATAVITVNGYNGTYDGNAHGATGSATGVSSEDLSSLLSLGASFTNVPGGTANWAFAGNSNYNPDSGSVAIVITKATPSFSNLSSPTITLGATLTSLGGKISLGSLVPTGSVSITLNGVMQSASIGAAGNFSSSFATGALPAANPPYAIAYSYAGDGNFNPASGSGTLTVGYGIVPLFDQTRAAQSGSTIPIRLQLTNAAGGNASSAGVVVTAVRLVQLSTSAASDVQDSGNANPDGNFRFDGAAYIFNLSTKGLASGTWQLVFTVSGDPTSHSLNFQVR